MKKAPGEKPQIYFEVRSENWPGVTFTEQWPIAGHPRKSAIRHAKILQSKTNRDRYYVVEVTKTFKRLKVRI